MNSSKPAIVFVPGMSSVGSLVFAPLIEQFKSLGFTTLEAIDLPSVATYESKTVPKPSTFEADVAAIRNTLERYIKSQDVLVVAHSYGGTVALCACDGLWKGKRNGVVKVHLLSASLLLPGQSVAGFRMDWAAKHPEKAFDESSVPKEQIGNETFIIPTGLEQVWMIDLPEEREKWGKTLQPFPISALMASVPAEIDPKAWKCSYLITADNDPGMGEDYQRFMIEQTREAGASIEPVTELSSGHFVQISHAKDVADWIVNQ